MNVRDRRRSEKGSLSILGQRGTVVNRVGFSSRPRHSASGQFTGRSEAEEAAVIATLEYTAAAYVYRRRGYQFYEERNSRGAMKDRPAMVDGAEVHAMTPAHSFRNALYVRRPKLRYSLRCGCRRLIDGADV